MGLFYKREHAETSVPYTISYGLEKTKLIVGLGNPGKEYELTRHNIGFEAVDMLVEAENGSWDTKKALKSLIADLRIGTTRLVICKPQNFMNLSGEAVQAVKQYYKVENSDMIVVHDDLDVPFGQIRNRAGGGAAGHNGIKSVMATCGGDFGRVRVGIGPKSPAQIDSADFVLQKFTPAEQNHLKSIKTEVVSILNEVIFGGMLTNETRKVF